MTNEGAYNRFVAFLEGKVAEKTAKKTPQQRVVTRGSGLGNYFLPEGEVDSTQLDAMQTRTIVGFENLSTSQKEALIKDGRTPQLMKSNVGSRLLLNHGGGKKEHPSRESQIILEGSRPRQAREVKVAKKTTRKKRK